MDSKMRLPNLLQIGIRKNKKNFMIKTFLLIQTSNSLCELIDDHMKYENTNKFKSSGLKGFREQPKTSNAKKVKRDGKKKRKDFFVQKGC